MVTFFTRIYIYFRHHRIAYTLILSALILLCGFGTAKIKLEEDISRFLPSSPETQEIQFVTANLKGEDNIILHLSAVGKSKLNKEYSIEASEFLVEEVNATASKYIDSIFYTVDERQIISVAEFIASNAPFFMEAEDYKRLDSLLNKDQIEAVIAQNKELLASPIGGVMESVILQDPLSMTSRVLGTLSKVNEKSQYTTYDSYLFSKDFSRQMVILTPHWGTNHTDQNKGLQEALDRAIEKTSKNFPQVKISYFGAPIIAASNATQIKRDSFVSITLSLILILGLMFYSLRSLRKMLWVLLPVIFGAIFALSILWLIQGSISAIAIGAGSIIFGIAISYSIHFILHSAHSHSMQEVLSEITQPMTIGSLSTVGAFLSLLFIKAEAMRDFGLFAALSLLGAILFVLIFLPHLSAQKISKRMQAPIRFQKISSYRFEKNKGIVWSITVLTIIFLCFAPKTAFDTDMQKINFMSDTQRVRNEVSG